LEFHSFSAAKVADRALQTPGKPRFLKGHHGNC